MLLCVRIVAPYAAESWINTKGPDEKDFVLNVSDVDLKLIKGIVDFNNVEMKEAHSKSRVAQADKIRVEFNLLNYLFGDKTLTVLADHVDLILTKGVMEELNHIQMKSESIVKARIEKLNVRQQEDHLLRTIASLEKTDIDLRGEKFSLISSLSEGGKLSLTGKTQNGSPWSITGNMTGVKSEILSRIAGQEMPITVGEELMNAEIVAETSGNELQGVIRPDSKNVKLVEVTKPKPRPWRPARKEPEPLVIEIPFTLKEQISLNFDETVNELRRRSL